MSVSVTVWAQEDVYYGITFRGAKRGALPMPDQRYLDGYATKRPSSPMLQYVTVGYAGHHKPEDWWILIGQRVAVRHLGDNIEIVNYRANGNTPDDRSVFDDLVGEQLSMYLSVCRRNARRHGEHEIALEFRKSWLTNIRDNIRKLGDEHKLEFLDPTMVVI